MRIPAQKRAGRIMNGAGNPVTTLKSAFQPLEPAAEIRILNPDATIAETARAGRLDVGECAPRPINVASFTAKRLPVLRSAESR